ncbi:MAG TPA: hypothetical protein VF230_13425 [Acidimicrobiales bacterium]
MRNQRLLVATGTLVALQVWHLLDVLRYADDATFPGVLYDPLGLAGVGAATAAFVATAVNHWLAGPLARVAGGAVAIGFTLHRGIPWDIGGVNNPYWGDGSADLIRWVTVLACIAVGAACVYYASPRQMGVRGASNATSTASPRIAANAAGPQRS